MRFHGRGVPKAGGSQTALWGTVSRKDRCLNELKAINHQLAADAPIDKFALESRGFAQSGTLRERSSLLPLPAEIFVSRLSRAVFCTSVSFSMNVARFIIV
jgi:hypothetical protein